VAIDSQAGDQHRGGRSVLIAHFASGFRLVYKPKSLAADQHFQEVLAWLNTHGDHPPFRTLAILDRGSYGWEEFVTPQPCTSSDEVRRFYQRQGGYLALLYALEATDLHMENLIAAGEHPMIIDLEALFQAHFGSPGSRPASVSAGAMLASSVLRVGLLPQRLWSDGEYSGIDVSALGATAGQLAPGEVPYWEDMGADTMRLVRKRASMSGAHNRPTLDGDAINPLDYSGAIIDGFTAIYHSLLRHRDELLAPDGLLARFSHDEVRVIVRPTRTYALMLQESFHPDVLQDALDRDCLFDRLWAGVEHSPLLAKVVPAERAALRQGDIPLFSTSPGSRDIWCDGIGLIPDFLDQPGMAAVHQRLRQLSDRDLERQKWFIRAALTTLISESERVAVPSYQRHDPQTPADSKHLLTAARAVGDRLELLALHGQQEVAWIGLSFVQQNRWSLAPLDLDLYDGLPGVALFLAYLGALTKEERYTSLARAVLATLRRQVQQQQSTITSIGGFEGWGGIIYTLTHLGVLWGQPALLAEAESLCERLPELIAQDRHLDIISGAAGCIGALLSLHACAPAQRTLDVAVQCGDRLVAMAQPMEHGMGWGPAMDARGPLTGFSHGAAGISWALLELAQRTDGTRFRQAALAGIAYERSLFSPAHGNWPDLRRSEQASQQPNDQPAYIHAWCHGAPGIGLARLHALRHLDDLPLYADALNALETTRAHGFGSNHSLCHGDLGNLELLFHAAIQFDDPYWQQEAHQFTAQILESIRRYGWLCGTPLGVETPGLMTGLAGIGYQLLRLAAPAHVPAVLMLAPPPAAGTSAWLR
jgi:type 2 lantibiotic biosynthesis protein LanM